VAQRSASRRPVQAPKSGPKRRKTPAPERPSGGIPRRWLYLGAAGLAVLVAVVLILVSVTGGDSGAPDTIDGSETSALLAGIPQEGFTLGSPEAPVTLVEWADPQCPFCARFATDVEPELIEKYVRSGDVKIEFRVFPFIGPDSIEASRYVYAAGLQNALFDVVDLLYRHQGGENDGWVTEALLRAIGNAVPGLDVEQWIADARSDRVAQAVEDDFAQAQAAGLQGTPSFVVVSGGRSEPFAVSELSVDAFSAKIDDALAGD
jgi:protein-disulfide isomerase